eukprot:CAMPEP_0179077526 /NCGR_PEP_ID=MMETSP0796-20121207/34659_1 /TAXON_ID=73915 /ORGANISM="Pyrodinium bahamense, Strain pbaha01" /LENGTH=149 /DNA_ID=CAMNT_0020774807 /DNA_START=24 /DNA_END=474 /DNA_ORIENTATION=+
MTSTSTFSSHGRTREEADSGITRSHLEIGIAASARQVQLRCLDAPAVIVHGTAHLPVGALAVVDRRGVGGGPVVGEHSARPVSLPPRYIVGVEPGSKTRPLTVPFHSSGIGGGASAALASTPPPPPPPALFFFSAALGGIGAGAAGDPG